MPKKRYTPEEIVAKLRQVDVLVSQGQNIADAIRQIGVSEVTYYRWRQEYGGLKADQVKRLKELEQENSRLRRAVSDLTLDKQILQEVVLAVLVGVDDRLLQRHRHVELGRQREVSRLVLDLGHLHPSGGAADLPVRDRDLDPLTGGP